MSVIASAGIGDPEGTRTVIAIVALLVVMGVALVMVAVWLFRTTRPDPEFLAPLELMGDRRWRRGDPVWQRRRLDEVRPPTAVPLTRSVAPPHFDEAFDDVPSVESFDDLHDARLIEAGHVDRPSDGDGVGPNDATQGVAGEPDVSIRRDRPLLSNETPMAARRPLVDELDGDFDPDLVARADAELDAELGASGPPLQRRGPTDR